ncbi:imelysin family protein [Roseovarius aestuarii]|nr:imelysin family protein [Roseovarius aestuarii]
MRLLACLLMILPGLSMAQSSAELIARTVDQHVMPRYLVLADRTADLRDVAQGDCQADSPDLRQAYGAAFDAWVGVSHLRFGPSEVDNRAFALAFWPDTRGATPKALGALVAASDPVAETGAAYAEVSIAARGFYALEFLLYDPALQGAGTAEYRCQLIRTVTEDIAAQAAGILTDWQNGYADQMKTQGPDSPYRDQTEAMRQLFSALTTGLEFTANVRLGRPLGTYDRPRATRAEARRSNRSQRHVALSLEALRDLALHLAEGQPEATGALVVEFDRTQAFVVALDDPVFAGVDDPQKRLKVEMIQQAVQSIDAVAKQTLGPALGVAAGFNALDGD